MTDGVVRRAALVTGGTRGIGAAISRRMAGDGIDVVAAYRSDDRSAAELVRSTAGLAGSVSTAAGDVSSAGTCRSLVDTVIERHGRLDHLVNNAGLLLEGRPGETDETVWERSLDVNLSAAWHLSQAALLPMTAQGFGRIVNVSSVTAIMGSPDEIAYGAAKAGLLGLSRSLSRAVARKGITVNCIVPGVFETDMTRAMKPTTQGRVLGMIPVGRRGDPGELAHAVAFLVDERAGYVTGAVIVVDGGLSMGG